MAGPSLPEILAPLAAWVQTNAPGSIPAGTIQIPLVNGQPLVLPFNLVFLPVVPVPAWTPPEEDEPFIPTVFQQAILDALEGKALRTDALGLAVGDRGRLYKPGGLKELIKEGLIGHHKRLGYYSTAAPPPELEDNPHP